MDVTPEPARMLAVHAVATASALSAAMATAVRNSAKTQGIPHLPADTRADTIDALVEHGVAGPRTRVGGVYLHFLTDHGNLVYQVLVKGADAVLFEATNPMPAAPVMVHLAPGEEDPHDDLTFTVETRACAGALTDGQAQALLECSIGDDGAYHYLTTTDETVAGELVALGLAAPKHHAGVYAGVHPLTARGSQVHDYLAIAPLLTPLPSLPVAAPTVPADGLAAFEHATAGSAQLAVEVAESLDAELAYRVATADRPDDSSDIRAYLDTRFVAVPIVDALVDMGIVAAHNVSVSWSSCSLRPLTRFGVLVRIALTEGRDAVLDGAREEIAAHRRRAIHRAADNHPADCSTAFCNGEPCYWPTCPDAIVDEPASTPATPAPTTEHPALSASAGRDSEWSSTTPPRTPESSHTDRCVANGWWILEDVGHCADATTTTTQPATQPTTEAAAPESPVLEAERAIATASALPASLREEIVAANNDPDGNEHVIYIDAMFSDPSTDAELISRGLVNEHPTIVDWFPLPLHRLTPFGLLVRTVLTTGPKHVLALARDEVERHRALEAHRAVPGHHPATCDWPECTTPSCDWPMCAMAAP